MKAVVYRHYGGPRGAGSRLRVPIAATYPLAQSAPAQTALKQRRLPGKIVLVV
jgi:NADPH:quinone reductase-like Zn-dependent oxidoreductase